MYSTMSHNHQQNQATNSLCVFGYVIAPLRKVSNNSNNDFHCWDFWKKYRQEPTRTFPNQPNTCLPMSKHHQLKRLNMNFYRPGAGVCSVTTHLWAQYATCGSDSCTWNSKKICRKLGCCFFFVAGFGWLGKPLKNIGVGNVSKHLYTVKNRCGVTKWLP